MARQVIVLSGASGSGKSVLARRLASEARTAGVDVVTVSADDAFFAPDGTYKWDGDKLGEAHDECFRNFLKALVTLPEGLVLVDNTNTTAADIAPYMRAASAFAWTAKVVRIMVDPKVAAARNGGRAPAKIVEEQAGNMNYQRLPSWWFVETVQAHEGV
jgi:tRNA uridine 5-carbamoylmethylation protein Kti12